MRLNAVDCFFAGVDADTSTGVGLALGYVVSHRSLPMR
ncbi:unannotated protein [freshwater metagenome]|uniref:Unannotated protein n=1 Tax=freshwater metagenome TaxID=449393 RepID=A0A6J6FSG9_9ZZZZ